MITINGNFQVVDGVHVCVPDDQHAASFSEQWDRWATVQVDSTGYRCGYAGCVNTADYFGQKTGLTPAAVQGRTVLDAGCGTGRFSEVAAGYGANMVAVDLSRAVFHAAKLGKNWPGEHAFIQASLERLPLPDSCIDVAFSIGVLHHTPNPSDAVREIARVLKLGGTFSGWVYESKPYAKMIQRTKWREFSTDPSNRKAILALAMEAPRLRDLFDAGRGLEAVEAIIRRVPAADMFRWTDPPLVRQIVGISGSKNDDECRLDSFDWMTPQHQLFFSWDDWNAILEEAGFTGAQSRKFPQSWWCVKR